MPAEPLTESEQRLVTLEDIEDERTKQLRRFGRQRHDGHKWMTILLEECGEAAKEVYTLNGIFARNMWTDPNDPERLANLRRLHDELIQVAAVAAAAAEHCLEELEG